MVLQVLYQVILFQVKALVVSLASLLVAGEPWANDQGHQQLPSPIRSILTNQNWRYFG
jgi:hypothetical protein